LLEVATHFFFFQAEDGIRDLTVTGVQTCALPILALCAWVGGPRHRLRPVDRAARGLQSFPRTMIRTVWFYAVLVVSSVIHASGVLVAALLGVKRRPGGIYDWGASDWARDIIAAAGPAAAIHGSRPRPPRPTPRAQPAPP